MEKRKLYVTNLSPLHSHFILQAFRERDEHIARCTSEIAKAFKVDEKELHERIVNIARCVVLYTQYSYYDAVENILFEIRAKGIETGIKSYITRFNLGGEKNDNNKRS